MCFLLQSQRYEAGVGRERVGLWAGGGRILRGPPCTRAAAYQTRLIQPETRSGQYTAH